MKHYLVFGGSGFLGHQIVDALKSSCTEDVRVSIVGRSRLGLNSAEKSDSRWFEELKNFEYISGVVWAQGTNIEDSIESWDEAEWARIMEANVTFVIRTLNALLEENLIARRARLVILGSVWQNLGRKKKLSYTVSKSAIRGLVNSLVADLSDKEIAVNAILPGVVDSPMARSQLSAEQIREIKEATPTGQLVTSDEVAAVVSWLISDSSSGLNGQFLEMDNGWSRFKNV